MKRYRAMLGSGDATDVIVLAWSVKEARKKITFHLVVNRKTWLLKTWRAGGKQVKELPD